MRMFPVFLHVENNWGSKLYLFISLLSNLITSLTSRMGCKHMFVWSFLWLCTHRNRCRCYWTASLVSTEHGSNDTWSMYQVGLCEEQTQPFPIFLHIKLSHIVVSLCILTYNWMLNYRLVILSILSL